MQLIQFRSETFGNDVFIHLIFENQDQHFPMTITCERLLGYPLESIGQFFEKMGKDLMNISPKQFLQLPDGMLYQENMLKIEVSPKPKTKSREKSHRKIVKVKG